MMWIHLRFNNRAVKVIGWVNKDRYDEVGDNEYLKFEVLLAKFIDDNSIVIDEKIESEIPEFIQKTDLFHYIEKLDKDNSKFNIKETVNVMVYGTLRANEYNRKRFVDKFGTDAFEDIKTLRIKGFQLACLEHKEFPYLIRNEHTSVVFELTRISKECYDAIVLMEEQSGYEVVECDIEGEGSFNVFILADEHKNLFKDDFEYVLDGDWLSKATLKMRLSGSANNILH